MANVKFEAIAKAGADKSGKAKWYKCGVVFESEKGLSLKVDSLPVGFDGWLSLKEPKPKDGSSAKGAFKDDDIGF